MRHLLASPLRYLIGGLIYMTVVMAAATLAYVAVGWSLGDAVYMVILTVYTVGYDEVRPVSTAELRIITMTLIVLGCTGMIFLTGAIVQLLTASQLYQILGLRRMQSQIDLLKDHVVICGFGRIGQMLARQLQAGKAKFVLVERSEARVDEARQLGYVTLQGNAEDEAVLAAAGVARARVLATVLPDDAANVFITLSARSLNANLTIVARGEAVNTESKLLQAGANRVIMPAHISAERLAEHILYPDTARVLHGTEHREAFARDLRALGLDLEVVTVDEGSSCVGRSIEAIEREAAGAFLIVGLNRRAGETIMRPEGSITIRAGDGVVIVGHPGRARIISTIFEGAVRRSARG